MFPGLADSRLGSWPGATGLGADVRAYGEWMRDEAQRRIGQNYPQGTLENGRSAPVIAWIWARTVTCPNPACGIEMPLVRSWWLCKKKGKEAWIRPLIVAEPAGPRGKRVKFEIGHGVAGAPSPNEDGTMRKSGGICVACGSAAELKYIRAEAQTTHLGGALMAVVVEGDKRRDYLAPATSHIEAAMVDAPDDVPKDLVTKPNHDVDRLPMYGMPRWCDAFTNRQLVALTTFSDLVVEARERVLRDTLESGVDPGDRLESGGSDAEAYADAVATYLGLVVSRCCDYSSSSCSWHVNRELIRNVFGRHAIPMTWDFAETMILSDSAGGFAGQVNWVAKVVEASPKALALR